MKIDTKFAITALNDKPIFLVDEKGDNPRQWTLGEVVSEALMNYGNSSKTKMLSLALDFYKQPIVELNASEFALIKQIVEETRCFTNNLGPARVLEYLNNLEEKK